MIDTNNTQAEWQLNFRYLAVASAAGEVVTIYDGAARDLAADVVTASGGISSRYWEMPAMSAGAYPEVTTAYYHGDHLGSARLVTSAQGYPVWAATYLPFGEEYRPSPTDHHHRFTGKERDSESGLDYFGARYYGSTMGRFTRPDSPFADQHTKDPQSWNLYTYARNNPLLFIDPTGQAVKESVKQVPYRVSAPTAAEAAAKARAPAGPSARQFTAVTEFTITWVATKTSSTQSSTTTSVTVESADVILEQTVSYPEWEERAGASPTEQEAWDSMMQQLGEHEQRHLDINREAANQLDRALPGTSGRGRDARAATNAATSAGNRKLDAAVEKATRKHNDLDSTTTHGSKREAEEPKRK